MKLIVIEGIDGAGKSTQIGLLRKYFSGLGLVCEHLHFPRTDEPYFGELIARFLRGEFGSLNNVDPWLVAMLYAGDRKDAGEQIRNWLNDGRVVLLDRYTYSNIAYQCAKLDDRHSQDLLMNWIIDLEFRHFGIPFPDLNIFLDVPISFTSHKLASSRTGSDRSYLNGTRDIHEESIIFQQKVRDMYLRVSESDERLQVITCSDEKGSMLPIEKIFGLIINIIKERNLF
ncbi:MAG TPA: dTMP kinase [Bacteroidales bacterium]|nr:dTMP kinase [Bacteroidales bacterium]HPF03884.1 dTMP kinase [Bacteroidales bacterium]HPJ58399.1 dTMP kinase [Bacteroidales bacterium]HPR10795.1 dTMP kinase [Bacteroidales bacterium]HRW85978.1 dTMP kinase [Bacteroidales bacterium]